MEKKSYEVIVKRKIVKQIYKLPELVQKKLSRLLKDLRDKGPVQPDWPNFSKLGKSKYHCHLGYNWVACWEYKNQTLIIEVYYVGSREKAPF